MTTETSGDETPGSEGSRHCLRKLKGRSCFAIRFRGEGRLHTGVIYRCPDWGFTLGHRRALDRQRKQSRSAGQGIWAGRRFGSAMETTVLPGVVRGADQIRVESEARPPKQSSMRDQTSTNGGDAAMKEIRSTPINTRQYPAILAFCAGGRTSSNQDHNAYEDKPGDQTDEDHADPDLPGLRRGRPRIHPGVDNPVGRWVTDPNLSLAEPAAARPRSEQIATGQAPAPPTDFGSPAKA